jgi:hypothetical protein
LCASYIDEFPVASISFNEAAYEEFRQMLDKYGLAKRKTKAKDDCKEEDA